MNTTAETTTHVTFERVEKATMHGRGSTTRFTRATCAHCGGRGLFGANSAETAAHVERNRWHYDCRP